MNIFSRSWEIAKLSFDVIRKDKELMAFPILSGIFSVVFIIAMLFPAVLAPLISGTAGLTLGATQVVLLFIVYLGLAFIATFFNVCVVYTTKIRFEGGNATFGESIKYALSKAHLILYWSLLSATVGIVLRAIEGSGKDSRNNMLRQVLSKVLGAAWGVITIFVIPAMVYYELTPINAIKKSIHSLKKTWGESLIRHFGLGLLQSAFATAGFALIILPFIFMSSLGGLFVLGIVCFGVLYLVVLSIIFNVVNSIFNTALFVYASEGITPKGYPKDILSQAFGSR